MSRGCHTWRPSMAQKRRSKPKTPPSGRAWCGCRRANCFPGTSQHARTGFHGSRGFPWNEMKLPIARILSGADTLQSTLQLPLHCYHYHIPSIWSITSRYHCFRYHDIFAIGPSFCQLLTHTSEHYLQRWARKPECLFRSSISKDSCKDSQNLSILYCSHGKVLNISKRSCLSTDLFSLGSLGKDMVLEFILGPPDLLCNYGAV